MAIHKTEYVQNARIIGLKSYFNDRIEGNFNLDTDSIYLNDIEIKDRYNFEYEFRVVFNTGYLFWNINDFFKENDSEMMRDLMDSYPLKSTKFNYRLENIFFIRTRYPNLNQLKEYYYRYDDRDIEFLNELFLRLFQKIVKRCGARYKEAVLKGATELAYALSHHYRLKQTPPS
jgi:hypothetical protein